MDLLFASQNQQKPEEEKKVEDLEKIWPFDSNMNENQQQQADIS